MSEQSPGQPLRDACNTLQEIQKSCEEPGNLERIRTHMLVLQSCVQRTDRKSLLERPHVLGAARVN